MEFDNDSVDVSGVTDLRGGGRRPGASPRGAALGGGGGLVAIIVTVLIVVLKRRRAPHGALNTDQATSGSAGRRLERRVSRRAQGPVLRPRAPSTPTSTAG